MHSIPFKISSTEYDIFVVLEEKNISRIKRYDPAELITRKLGEPWTNLRLRNIVIGYATDEDLERVKEFAAAGVMREALNYLSRGWEYKPGHDSDEPYVKIHEENL